MEQGLLQRAQLIGGVSTAQIVATVGGSLLALTLLLACLSVGARAAGLSPQSEDESFSTDEPGQAAFVVVIQAALTISCAVLVVVFRPRARAETHAGYHAALVEEIISDDLARAAEH